MYVTRISSALLFLFYLKSFAPKRIYTRAWKTTAYVQRTYNNTRETSSVEYLITLDASNSLLSQNNLLSARCICFSLNGTIVSSVVFKLSLQTENWRYPNAIRINCYETFTNISWEKLHSISWYMLLYLQYYMIIMNLDHCVLFLLLTFEIYCPKLDAVVSLSLFEELFICTIEILHLYNFLLVRLKSCSFLSCTSKNLYLYFEHFYYFIIL